MTDFDMLVDGTYTAVVDAIEDGLATVFFEQDGEEVGNAILAASVLPEDGRHADAIFTVSVDSQAVTWDYEPKTTEDRKEAAQSRFDRLSSRAPSDEDS
jgi:hypothetical protein